mmetsp:Transcript_160602/g.490953  ORF Transcript_160602/g.490953 Transcript_160602/m.490953 type:complete len:243 (-) Transcript_160602:608-1336(-)
MKEGVILFSVLANCAAIASSCFVSRCTSLSTSMAAFGTGKSTSKSSDTTVRTTPSAAVPLSPKAPTSTCSGSARASQAMEERSACRACWKTASSHQKVRGGRSFGGMLCSALVLRIWETRLHILANQPSASSSRKRVPALASTQGLIIKEEAADSPRGSLCHTASVTNGMNGCKSFREVSSAYRRTLCEIAPSLLVASPPKCSCNLVFEISRYQEAKSSCTNSFTALVGGAKLFSRSACVTV